MFLVESTNKENYTELSIFSRDKSGNKQIKIVNDFKPYFYIDSQLDIPEDKRITNVETGYKGIDNSSLTKIYVQKSSDINDLKNQFPEHYEADIMFTHRYIIDEIGEIETYPLKVCYLDIETNSSSKFPNLLNPDQEIITISVLDSFTNNELTFYYESPDCINKVTETDNIKVFDSEESMLNAFINYIRDSDPDIISGWNVISFDLIYLIRRMNKLELDYKKLSSMNFVKIDDKWEDVTIKGRIVFDMMHAYKYFRQISNQGRAESYSLEFCSQEVLKTGKIKHEKFFNYMWINEPKNLIEYNKRDVTLVKDINDKFQIIDFFNTIRSKACSNFRNVYHSSILIDGLLLSRTKGKYVLPSANKKNTEEAYSGAYVVTPIPGIYKDVIGLDVKGMYPNIIKTFNMSYETFNPKGEIQITPGIGFNKGQGLIPSVVIYLEKERAKNRDLMKQAYKDNNEQLAQLYHFRQYSVKVLTNAIYGYLGFPKARLYRKEVAEAITTMGRRIIGWTKTLLENKGYIVIYGDTDSVYVKAKTNSYLYLIKEGKDLSAMITESYIDLANRHGADKSTLEIQFEKLLKSCIFVTKKGEEGGAKKKYAYIATWKDGKNVKDEVEFTGFSTVRSDSPRIGRKVQKTVIEMLLNETPKNEVVSYLEDLERKIRSREISDEDIGFPKGITKELEEYGQEKIIEGGIEYVGTTLTRGHKIIKIGNPPAIKGAIYANKYLGRNFTKGSKPKWIYIKKVPFGLPETSVIAYEEHIPDGFIPDYDLMTDRIFKNQLNEIFKSAGWGEFPTLNKTTQSLNNYF